MRGKILPATDKEQHSPEKSLTDQGQKQNSVLGEVEKGKRKVKEKSNRNLEGEGEVYKET